MRRKQNRGAAMSADALVKEIFIDAAPDVVFGFLTDAQKMVRWMGIAAELEPTPGGVYRLDPNGRDVILGKYLEVTPNTRVVFTWGWEEPGHSISAGSTVVEIELRAEGKGTRLKLTHCDLPPEQKEKHSFGWDHYLARLKSTSEGHDPGRDPYSDPSFRHG
jgi:uncharacterized protein YndB with AHSA1/START domain